MRIRESVKVLKPDSAGRILIGKENSAKLYVVQPQENGDILLSPVVLRHEREAWLFDNKDALESVIRGLEESARGDTHDLGSFAEHAEDDLD